MALSWPYVLDSLIVALLGLLTGVAELVSRYRDAPASALKTRPGMLYIALNGLAALSALALIRAFGWNFGVNDPQALRWTQVLIAGFGSMALFRSSLLTVHAGDQDIGVGPVSFLQVVMGASDRAVDRIRARARAKAVETIMANIDFDKAYQALPAYALALMQNLPDEDANRLTRQVTLIVNTPTTNKVKLLMLGLALMNIVGEDALSAAVESLKQEMGMGQAIATAPVSTPVSPGPTQPPTP